MAYKAVIVESPAKCTKIEYFLGSGYKCMASFGHIRTIDNLSCIDVKNDFTPSFKVLESKKKQIKALDYFINKASEVILATDDDREGEAIAWHICQQFNLNVKTTKRIVFHEITHQAINYAVEHHKFIDMSVVRAQQTRQILDLIVGFKLSPVLWANIAYKTVNALSAGRCQTPALRLIYENQKDIELSPGVKNYNTVGYFTSQNLEFILNFNHDSVEQFLIKSSSFKHDYSCGEVRNTSKTQPTPYTTSTLQQECSSVLKMSPKNTMESCQKLYEAGYITYMRTDSTTYSLEFISTAKEFISDTYGKEFILSDIERLSEKKNDAHEAIRSTDICIETIEQTDGIGAKEISVYSIIRRNSLESCMTPATFKSLTAKITAPDDYEYKHSTEQIIFPGWKIVNGYDKTSPTFVFLQTLKPGSIEYKRILSKATMKQLKNHYTEATLVRLLEECGIGRPSTFASLVDKIQERGYVKKSNIDGKKFECVDYELEKNMLTERAVTREFGCEKGKLIIQPIGTIVIEFLLKHFDGLFNYEYTKNMENKLDLVAKDEYLWHTICRDCYVEIEQLSKGLYCGRSEIIEIDDKHTYMIAKYGPVIKCVDDGKTTFKKVSDDIDVEKLRQGKYNISELIKCKTTAISVGRYLGNHEGNNVVLKQSKYGMYVEWGESKINIKLDGKVYDSIELTDVESLLVKQIILEISPDASIRNGSFGRYIYYKTKKMKKPKFITVDNTLSPTCSVVDAKSWLSKKHKIEL